MQAKNKKEQKIKVATTPVVCCPYFDDDKKMCSHPDCIRMLGMECKYTNRTLRKGE